MKRTIGLIKAAIALGIFAAILAVLAAGIAARHERWIVMWLNAILAGFDLTMTTRNIKLLSDTKYFEEASAIILELERLGLFKKPDNEEEEQNE